MRKTKPAAPPPPPKRLRLMAGVPLQVQIQVAIDEGGTLRPATISMALRIEDGAKLVDLVELARAKAEHKLQNSEAP